MCAYAACCDELPTAPAQGEIGQGELRQGSTMESTSNDLQRACHDRHNRRELGQCDHLHLLVVMGHECFVNMLGNKDSRHLTVAQRRTALSRLVLQCRSVNELPFVPCCAQEQPQPRAKAHAKAQAQALACMLMHTHTHTHTHARHHEGGIERHNVAVLDTGVNVDFPEQLDALQVILFQCQAVASQCHKSHVLENNKTTRPFDAIRTKARLCLL
jgi:hypothetical protein